MAEGHDIFLSYASEDLERVRPLIRALEERGWQVWWDRTMLPGDDYEEVIDQAIADARCVIVVWSRASADSNWVRAEADEGRRLHKLVPVMLDEVRLPLSFRATHTAPLMDWQAGVPHQEFERVVQAVTNLVPPPPPDEEECTEPRIAVGPDTSDETTRGSKAGLIWSVSLGVVVLALVVWLVVVKRPEPGTYALTIRATPADSTVRLVDTDITYRPGVKLTPGRYTVEIARDGYKSVRRDVVIAVAAVALDATLTPVKTTYKLTVRAFPEDSTIKILNIVPKYRPGIALAPGEYGVRVQREGYATIERRVRIVDRNVTLTVRLEKVEVPEPRIPPLFRNSIGMEFVSIPDGEFAMGSSADEVNDVVKQYNIPREWVEREVPKHTVRISKPFYLGKYEVTQRQWQAVMGKNPSRFTGNLDLPVEQVSWEESQEFVAKLNGREPGERYRLPTEAEWEYAARAGSTTAYSFGNDPAQLEEYAWYEKNAGSKTHQVGERKPNAWGLHDMHGNVWEWVQDWYGKYSAAVVTDPARPAAGSARVLRGGSWYDAAGGCRSAYRGACSSLRFVYSVSVFCSASSCKGRRAT